MRQLSVLKGQGHEAPQPPREDPLGEVVPRAVEGDREAIAEILRSVGPSMLRVTRTVLGARAMDVEDIYQEGLLALVGALPSFRGQSGVRHFACRIAARTAVRARRRASKAREKQRSLASKQAPLVEGLPSPPSAALAERRKTLLRRLLEELPEEQAETLALRVVLGYSLGDVAETTGVPVNTVRSRIRLAKVALRRRIEADPSAAELVEVES